MADRHKNTKQAKRREKQEAAQRFLEDRLGRLEAVREMVNAELDRRKDEFADHSKVENKDLSKSGAKEDNG